MSKEDDVRQSGREMWSDSSKLTYKIRGVASGRGVFHPRMPAMVGYTSARQSASVLSRTKIH
jgi:N-acetylglutamate synthase/N-acetylornithine aminotransferase